MKISHIKHVALAITLIGVVGSIGAMEKSVLNQQLYTAARKGQAERVENLIQAGANVNIRTRRTGTTPLMAAAQSSTTYVPFKAVAELLIKAKADVNAKNKKGKTALYFTISRANPTLAKILINAKADVHAKDNEGQTLLGYVRQLLDIGQPKNRVAYETIEELLIKAGAN